MSIISAGGAVVGAGGPTQYEIERSLRFNSADSAYLNRTLTTPTNNLKWTWSAWVKRSTLSANSNLICAGDGTSNNSAWLVFNPSDVLQFYQLSGGAYNLQLTTTAVFRDASAWYHIVLIYDSANATSTNRVQIYVNGVLQTVSYAVGPFAINTTSRINSALAHFIGKLDYTTQYSNGYQTEINFIDGQALTPTSFGEYNTDTGVWQPKAYSGSYGTNGFYLNFSDNSGTTSTTLGKDQAGSNNWTPNNFSVTAGAGNDSLVDTPTNYGTDTGVGGEVRGNYTTWNALDRNSSGTLANGNLDWTSGTTAHYGVRGTMSPPSGKWYFEVTASAATSGSIAYGIGMANAANPLNQGAQGNTGAYILYGVSSSMELEAAGVQGSTISGASIGTNDVIQVAYDVDASKMWVGKNNTYYDSSGGSTGNPGTGANPSFSSLLANLFPFVEVYNSTVYANFGQRPFAYTAPSGFKALCTQNLPEPTIVDGSEYFDVATWTGDGVSPKQVVTSLKFQPDFIWDKSRSRAGIDHSLYDSVRGVGSGKVLSSDTTNAEGVNDAIYGFVSSINSNGFTTTAGSTNNWFHNFSGDTYVAWNWKANGAGVSNTAGTITSTVSANTDAGFSIVTWTANGSSPQTIGHGLGVAPSMIITKQRNGADNWFTYHASLGATKNVRLDETAAAATQTGAWNNTAPTSTVFSTGNFGAFTTNGNTLVAYCFAAKESYSSAFSFTGNGSADGSFVFLGFRPAWVLIKRTDSTSNWTILDFQREGYNVDNDPLFPNLSNAEGTTDLADLLSNGFKLRTTDASVNASGGTYIGFAVAQNPFKYSLGR